MSKPMTHSMPLTRRRLLTASLVSLGAAAAAGPMHALAAAPAALIPAPAPAPASDTAILAAARTGLARVGGRIAAHDVVGVADFGRPSSQPRLHLVDVASGKVTSLLVAHGRGSDPAHTGWLKAFSNTPGSDATSQGAFLTGAFYEGEHGRSMRLDGLDPTNSNARERGIVVHSAWYVGDAVVQTHGMLGRSEGCFAVSPADLPQVLSRLGPGRLLVATKI